MNVDRWLMLEVLALEHYFGHYPRPVPEAVQQLGRLSGETFLVRVIQRAAHDPRFWAQGLQYDLQSRRYVGLGPRSWLEADYMSNTVWRNMLEKSYEDARRGCRWMSRKRASLWHPGEELASYERIFLSPLLPNEPEFVEIVKRYNDPQPGVKNDEDSLKLRRPHGNPLIDE